ncbi:MAG TPA: hypothetical protein PLR71_11345 [Deltaproteobacteria bacterium]|nr:hypothetical protein [Deltaproteobacteria bacterium]
MVLACPVPSLARGLESRVLGKQLFEALPKDLLSVTIEVENGSGQRVECMPAVELPSGWKPITQDHPFTLEPGGSEVRLVSFFIPSAADTGEYDIQCIFASKADPSLATRQTIRVTVLPVAGLTVRFVDAPRRVVAGEEYEAAFLVGNAGNQEQRVHVVISSLNDLPAVADRTDFSLGPGASHQVRVTVRTRESDRGGFTHRVTCRAEVAGNEETHAMAQSFVEVIPSRARPLEGFHRIPSALRLRQALQSVTETTTAAQLELEGQGSLDEGDLHRVEFLFRGPDTLDKTVLGSRDNYSLRASSPVYEVVLGDAQYSLTPLTEQFFTACGAGGTAEYRGLALKGYYARSRWDEPHMSQAGGAFGYAFPDTARVSFQGLSKDQDDMDDSQSLFTASVELTPMPWMELHVEGGSGTGPDETDSAYLGQIACSGAWGSAHARYIHAGPDFPGYYQDRELISLSLSGPITDTVQVNASLDQERGNLDKDQLLQQAPLDLRAQTGLSFRPYRDTTYTLSLYHRRLKDLMDSPEYEYTEYTLRSGMMKNVQALSCNLFAEAGARKDLLNDRSDLIYQISASAYLRSGQDRTYGAHLRYAHGENSDTGTHRTITAGVSGTGLLRGVTQVTCGAQVDAYPDSSLGNKYLLSASARHPAGSEGSLLLKATQTLYDDHDYDQDETTLILEYEHRFGLPVARKAGVSSVSGVVKDALTGAPLGGVLLRLDQETFATGPDGRFAFTSARPGPAYLSIDASRIGLDRIPACDSPLGLDLEAGTDHPLEILVTTKAVLTGQVVLHRAAAAGGGVPYELEQAPGVPGPKAQGRELVEAEGLANILVILTGPGGTVRTLTDTRGRFRFTELRPGAWTLTVDPGNLPAYHAPESAEMHLNLSPGEVKDLTVRVLPQKRRIRIMEEGGTVVQPRAP